MKEGKRKITERRKKIELIPPAPDSLHVKVTREDPKKKVAWGRGNLGPLEDDEHERKEMEKEEKGKAK